MTRESVKVKDGRAYDHYFPPAKLRTIVEKEGATVADTLKLIPAVIRQTAWQTRRFAHEAIKADTLEQTCRNLWHFVYDHIAYKKDELGKEQVRDAARTWHDRHNVDPQTGEPMGVDCDCMTTFICSVLYNLEIRNVYFRIAKYEESYWEHIYPIIKLPNGKHITIDCVLHQFNQEAKYTAKQDTPMDLEYLNGVSGSMNKLTDAPDLMGIMDEQQALATLGKIFKKKAAKSGGSAPKKGLFKKKAGGTKKPLFKKKTAEQKKANKAKIKKFIGKALNVTNKINPVTVALRNGVLAGMKLNFMKIGESLRWAYLSPEQAQAKGADMNKYNKLKNVLTKLEKIFYGAGGKPENLKKAILTGRGNRDKAVAMNGLGYVAYENVDGLHEEMPLNELLGYDIYHSENVDGMEGLDGFEGLEGFGEEGDLGSATAASVAAATTVLGSIAALIKSIGSLFPGKGGKVKGKKAGKGGGGGDEGSADEASDSEGSGEDSGSYNTADEGTGNSESGSDGSGGSNASGSGDADGGGSDEERAAGDDEGTTNGSGESASASKSSGGGDTDEGELKPGTVAKAKAFWEKNKKWMKPTGIALGALGVICLAYKLLTPKKPSLSLSGLGSRKRNKKAVPNRNLLNGLKAKKGGRSKAKRKPIKKKTITLL